MKTRMKSTSYISLGSEAKVFLKAERKSLWVRGLQVEVSPESEQGLQNDCVLKYLSTSHLLSSSFKFIVRSQETFECLGV